MKQGGILVAATRLGPRFQADPELRLPRRPRLPPEIIVIPFGREGMLFEGGKRTQLLTGTSSRTLLPAVLDQLDGTKTIDEVAAALPHAPANHIRNIIAALFSCGLLEDGVSPSPSHHLRDLDAFLGRFVDVTRNNANRGEAMRRLCGSRVAIVGDAEAAKLISAELGAAGAKSEVLANPNLEEISEEIDQDHLLIAVTTRQGQNLSHILDAAYQRGIKVLQVQVGRKEAQIGPLFMPHSTACHECSGQMYGAPEGDASPASLPLWLSMASLQAVHVIARTADVRLSGGFESYEQTAHGLVHRFRYVARLPGCSRCGIDGSKLLRNSGELLAWLYHNSVAMPPQEVSSRRVHQWHYLAQNVIETGRLPEAYQGGLVTDLPVVVPSKDCAVEAPHEVGLGVNSLATLLNYSAGYQNIEQEQLRRIAPTGGAMGSPDLFVIANSVPRLRRGLYHYHGPRHVLEWLRDVVPEDVVAAFGATRWEHPCTIIGTGALQKLRSKYQNFSYRIVNLDAGVALRILYELTSAMGIPAKLAPDIHDDGVARLIGLPRKDNQLVVTFVLGLGDNTARALRPFQQLGLNILDALISESTLPKVPKREPFTPSENKRFLGSKTESCTHLLNRRTVREYGDRAVAETDIQTVAEAASYADERYRLDAPMLPKMQQWWFVRSSSPQLETGVYEYDSLSHRLVLRGPNPGSDVTSQCLNQRALTAAPLMLFLTADLGASLQIRGARGYREVLLQAGNACGSVLITAETIGLAACPTAGILEPGFRQITGCDGYNQSPIVAICLGHHGKARVGDDN